MIQKALAERSLAQFIRLGWPYIDPNDYCTNWHIDAICEHLEAVTRGDLRRLIVNIPPRSMKSISTAVAWPAWTWAQQAGADAPPLSGPRTRFLYASYAHTLSIRDSLKCRRLIESPWYQENWGDRFSLTGDQNTKVRFENDKFGYRLSTSVDGALTGEGGDCLPAGTMVATPTGPKPIECVEVSDIVWCYDHNTRQVKQSRVVATAQKSKRDICELHFSDGRTLRCTGDHKVFVAGAGYVRADQLLPGAELVVLPDCGRETGPVGGFGVQSVRSAIPAPVASLRDRNPAGAREGVLHPRLRRGQQCADATSLRPLREGSASSRAKVLLARLRKRRAGREQYETTTGLLRSVRQAAPQEAQALLSEVRGRHAQGSHAGTAQASGRGGERLPDRVSVSSGASSFARPVQLRGVWGCGGSPPVSSRGVQLRSSRPSHRREQAQQRPGEPDHSVRLMPQDAPPIGAAVVTAVFRHGTPAQCVYDIQVAGAHNFFADGVLVHNCVVIDDPHNATEIHSETMREIVLSWFEQAMSTRLNNPRTGAYVIIMQRLHEDDLTGHILANNHEDYTHLCLPARYEPDHPFVYAKDPRTKPGELLWPSRQGEGELSALERSMGAYGAAGQLQQRPAPRDGGLFQGAWFDTINAAPMQAMRVRRWDLAASEVGRGAADPDWTVGVLMARCPDGLFYVEDVVRMRGSAQDVERTILNVAAQDAANYGASNVKIALSQDPGQAGKAQVGYLTRKLAGFMVSSVSETGSKLTRAQPFASQAEAGNVRLVKGKWNKDFIQELEVFPNGKHDDQVDAASGAFHTIIGPGIKGEAFLELARQINSGVKPTTADREREVEYAKGSVEWAAQQAALKE